MKSKIEDLVEEFVELLKEGNIQLEQVVGDPFLLASHPDFDRAIDILSELEETISNG